MTATRTEKVPRYSSTSRNAQLLRPNAAHSHTHSNQTSGASQAAQRDSLLTLHGDGRVLGWCRIIGQSQFAAMIQHCEGGQSRKRSPRMRARQSVRPCVRIGRMAGARLIAHGSEPPLLMGGMSQAFGSAHYCAAVEILVNLADRAIA